MRYKRVRETYKVSCQVTRVGEYPVCIDVHKRYSYAAIVDDLGRVVEETGYAVLRLAISYLSWKIFKYMEEEKQEEV